MKLTFRIESVTEAATGSTLYDRGVQVTAKLVKPVQFSEDSEVNFSTLQLRVLTDEPEVRFTEGDLLEVTVR